MGVSLFSARRLFFEELREFIRIGLGPRPRRLPFHTSRIKEGIAARLDRSVEPDGHAETTVDIEPRGEDEVVRQPGSELAGDDPYRIAEPRRDLGPGEKVGPPRVGLGEVHDEHSEQMGAGTPACRRRIFVLSFRPQPDRAVVSGVPTSKSRASVEWVPVVKTT